MLKYYMNKNRHKVIYVSCIRNLLERLWCKYFLEGRAGIVKSQRDSMLLDFQEDKDRDSQRKL